MNLSDLTCSKCGQKLESLIALCSDPGCRAEVIRLTPAQEDEVRRKEEANEMEQVHKVIGLSISCEPEMVVESFWRRLLNKLHV
jgi:hypothetical protein